MQGLTIRSATVSDIQAIHDWLSAESITDTGGSFLYNFSLIEQGQKKGELVVLIRDGDGLPVAFALGEANVDIFAVHYLMRRRGIGRYLARYIIDRAIKQDLIGLFGKCSPATSKPFWIAMGFTEVTAPYGGDDPDWVALPLPQERVLPTSNIAEVVISASQENHECLRPFITKGNCEKGMLYLERDFCCYQPGYDACISISLDGVEIYEEKVKNLRKKGVERHDPWTRVRAIQIASKANM